MLTDVHSICGYLIAKYLYEQQFTIPSRAQAYLPQSHLFKKFQQSAMTKAAIEKRSSYFIRQLKTIGTSSSKGSQILSLRNFIRFVKRVLASLSFEERYLLCGMILGNLPDIDVLMTPFVSVGFHSFHRTITHSIYGNMIMVPIAGYIMYRSLGLKGYQSLRHCIYFTLLCVTSHIITDYITNYGTSIFYPVSAKPYTLGVITVWDFTTVAFFYGMLTLSRHSVFKQRNIMIYGVLIFAVLMIWKRAMLCEAYSQNYHVMEKKKKSARSTKIWLQPNNFYNGKFSVIKYDPKHDRAELERTVEVSSYLSIVHYLNEIFRFKQFDTRRVQMSETIGRFQGVCPPREFFPSLKRNNHNLLKQIVLSSLPTFSFMTIYHLFYITRWILRKLK